MAYGDEQEQDFGMGGPGFGLGPDVRAGPDLAPGYDASTDYAGGATGGPEEAFSATDAIGSMADVLDEAASSVSGGDQDFQTTGPAVAGTMGQGGVSMAGVTTPDLGSNPTLDQLQSVIDSVGQDTQADVMPGGAATDLLGGEEVIDDGPAGEQAATFLSDFNRGMSGQGPEQEFDPSAAVMGGAPEQAVDPLTGAVNTVETEGAAGGWGGNAGWNDPNTVTGQLAILSGKMDRLEDLSMALQTVQKGYPQPNMNVSDYQTVAPAWQNPNTVRPPLESPNYPAWQNPNTVRPPLEGANFPPDWYNVNEQRAYPTAMGGNLPPISAQEAAATATGGGEGWVDPNASFEDLEAQFSASPQVSPQVGGGAGWVNPNATFEELEAQFSTSPQQAATTLAPKYTGEGYQTHNEMYPNHRNYAAMAGVASIKSMFDGTHKAWIESVNQDMKDKNIELTHTVDGKAPNGIPFGQEGSNLSGKHSSGNWKEYAALFDPETGLDKNGVPMPGTDKQAQAGMGGVLQGLWGGILSGAQDFFKPKTGSGVEDPYANLGYPPHASGNIPANIRQPSIRSEGDDARGDNPVDIIRSSYTWASSLPNNVLFNAARYPDYLRLLIEYDAAGKDLPLTVPTWILEGTDRPAEDEEETSNWITNHPAMQRQELTWLT